MTNVSCLCSLPHLSHCWWSVCSHVVGGVLSERESNWMGRGDGLFNHRHDRIMTTEARHRVTLYLVCDITHNDAHACTCEYKHRETSICLLYVCYSVFLFFTSHRYWFLSIYLTNSQRCTVENLSHTDGFYTHSHTLRKKLPPYWFFTHKSDIHKIRVRPAWHFPAFARLLYLILCLYLCLALTQARHCWNKVCWCEFLLFTTSV